MNRSVDDSGQRPIYPPTALVVMAPLAKIGWPRAVLLYVWACTFGYFGLVWILSGHAGDSWISLRRVGFVAFALGLSPVHAGINQANLSILVFLLSGYALYLAWIRYELVAGVLLALGFCMKPTSAMAVVTVLVLYGRRRSILAFLGVSGAIAGCAAMLLSHIDSGWRLDYAKNLQFLFGPNGAASFWTANPGRFDLVNLQVPAYAVVHSVPIANLLAIVVSAVFGVIWLLLFFVDRDTRDDWYWLGASSLLLVALLPVYQRNYNTAVILFAVMWAFRNLHEALAKAVLVVSGLFLIPGEAMLRKEGLADRLSDSTLWNALIMSQATWAIVTVIVLCSLYKARHGVPMLSIRPRCGTAARVS